MGKLLKGEWIPAYAVINSYIRHSRVGGDPFAKE